LALKHNAILVTPDYRLRPEAQLADEIEDMRDFWKWIRAGLSEIPGIKVDTANLAIVGESAGGTMTAQSVLLDMIHPVRVIIMQYPGLNIGGHLKWLESLPEKISVSVLEDHLASSIPGHIVTRVANGSRSLLVGSMMQNGRFVDVENDAYLDPMKSLETAGPLPPVLLFHGGQDKSVRASDSAAWAEKLRRLQPDVPLHLVFPDGDHCFDQSDVLATPWLKEPIAFVEQYWPAQQ
jgi:acetyl esterase/lipase